ncbi:hypothetical protein Pcinc_043678 [Petrolisthes cinctipes]|uniref:Uncharacterized protein n=1 Tax=Petrolisthes cinctipes TaxID=88211 RepID=A0AAE1BG92_PETCI|nr:hypothetical protein Pcinc_043678 [Petrolisthes cinctipes]
MTGTTSANTTTEYENLDYPYSEDGEQEVTYTTDLYTDDQMERIISVGAAEGIGVFLVQLLTMTVLAMAAVYVVFVVTLPSVENRSFSWGPLDALAEGEWWSLQELVTNSVDSAHSLLDRLEVDQKTCMKLAVCEAQRAAPAITPLATVMNILRPTLQDWSEWKEAQDAGDTHQDCNEKYPECSSSLSKAVWWSAWGSQY